MSEGTDDELGDRTLFALCLVAGFLTLVVLMNLPFVVPRVPVVDPWLPEKIPRDVNPLVVAIAIFSVLMFAEGYLRRVRP